MKKTLGQVLKARRLLLGISQRELARRLGVKPSHVGYLEGGHRRPSLSLLSRLGSVLGLQTEPLLFLAHPEARELLDSRTESTEHPPRDQAWRTFARDKNMIRRYRITPREMKVLSQVNLLGRVSSPRDFLFILNSIRHAVEAE